MLDAFVKPWFLAGVHTLPAAGHDLFLHLQLNSWTSKPAAPGHDLSCDMNVSRALSKVPFYLLPVPINVSMIGRKSQP